MFIPAVKYDCSCISFALSTEKVEKVVWDFFKEGLVGEVDSMLLMVGLVEEVGLLVEI